MPDPVTNLVGGLFNGTTAGIPNIVLIMLLGAFAFIIYLVLTRKPGMKEFKPLDMKKETRRRFKRGYKFFGVSLNKNLFVINDEKPIAFIIGYMKVVENDELKRLEPIYTKFSKEQLEAKHESCALEVYQKQYKDLSVDEKKNINEVAKEELRNERIEVMDKNEYTKIVKGKREVKFSVPVSMFAFRVCAAGFMPQLLAKFIGVGTDWMLFNSDQVKFETDRVVITANFQRRTPNDIFVFSNEGKNMIQDITYEVERENVWQEVANQIPRAVHFDTEASKALIYRREDAKIDREKHKSQSESHEI